MGTGTSGSVGAHGPVRHAPARPSSVGRGRGSKVSAHPLRKVQIVMSQRNFTSKPTMTTPMVISAKPSILVGRHFPSPLRSRSCRPPNISVIADATTKMSIIKVMNVAPPASARMKCVFISSARRCLAWKIPRRKPNKRHVFKPSWVAS